MRRGWLMLAATAVAVAACSTPRTPDRAIPADVGDATFLSVTNDARAPLVVGSRIGMWVSRDSGSTWRFLHPVPIGAVAIAYTRSRAIVSRGTLFERRDLGLHHIIGQPQPWGFSGRVVALASEPRYRRIWALTRAPARLEYSNDDGRSWYLVPMEGLCSRPLRLAATPPGRGELLPHLFAACGAAGLYRSDDLGVTFAQVPGATWTVTDVVSALGVSGALVIVTPVVRVSRDGGRDWATSGLSAARVALDPRNALLIWAIAENGRLFTSVNGGRSF